MSITNCTECGTLCLESLNRLCPRCQQYLYDAEYAVAEYLRLNEGATLDQVHDATKVKKHIILKMIREGRIIEGRLVYPCERCKNGIRSGRYCKTCEDLLLDSLDSPREESGDAAAGKGMFIRRLVVGG